LNPLFILIILIILCILVKFFFSFFRISLRLKRLPSRPRVPFNPKAWELE